MSLSERSYGRSSSGRVTCETAAAFTSKDTEEQDDTTSVRCFACFRQGGLFQLLSPRLVGGSERKDLKKARKSIKKRKKKHHSGPISFNSVPEEPVSYNLDPVSPSVSCIGQVRAGKQSVESKCRLCDTASEGGRMGWRTSLCLGTSRSVKENQLTLQESRSSASNCNEVGEGEYANGCILAKSLVLLEQRIEESKADGGITSTRNSKSSSSSGADLNRCPKNEVCLWKRRLVPQPQLLQVEKPVPCQTSFMAVDSSL